MNSLKKIRYNSPVILTFVLISFGAFIINFITRGWANRMLFSVYRSSPGSPLFYIRLVGHVFGHADWPHFSGNMITILLVGPLLEEKFGQGPLLFLLAGTSVITGLVHILLFSSGLLGASGIVFAMIMTASITSMRGEGIPLTFLIVAVFYFGGQIYEGLFIRNEISNLTHILGGLMGCGFGFLAKPGRMMWH